MTKLKLFLELLDTMNHLLTTGMTSRNVYEARMYMDDLFTKFDELNYLETTQLDNLLNTVTLKVTDFPKELKQYFQLIETFQAENEIYLQDLPLKIEEATIEQFQLILAFFIILNELLETGMTDDGMYQAHKSIDDLFKEFEEEAEAYEDRLRAELNAMSNDLEAMPINIGTFFQDLTHHLGIPILLDEMECVTNGAI
jgi:hypothetical protein